MKYKASYLMLFILILSFSFVFQGIYTFLHEPDNKDIYSNYISLHASNSELCEYTYEWNRTLLMDPGFFGVAVNSLDEIYVAGYNGTVEHGWPSPIYKGLLVKYDKNGTLIWSHMFGFNTFAWDHFVEIFDVALDSMDNIYVTGKIAADDIHNDDWDVFIAKFNSTGIQLWNRSYSGSIPEYSYEAFGIAIDSNDNIFVTGEFYYSSDPVNRQIYLLKYSNNGDFLDFTLWGGGHGYAIACNSNDDIFIGGKANIDYVLLKYNNSCSYQWNRTFDSGGADSALGLVIDSLNNVYQVGSSSVGGNRSIFLVKYNSIGGYEWHREWRNNRTLDILNYTSDYGMYMNVDSSDNVYFTGRTKVKQEYEDEYDMLVAKYDPSGNYQWNFTWDRGGREEGIEVVFDSLDNLYVCERNHLIKYMKLDLIPQILIHEPYQDEVFGHTPPKYNISVDSLTVDTMWYTIDEGLNTYNFSALTGTVNQSAWDKKGSGIISLRFYVNNSWGDIGYAERIIYKDIDKPIITINTPLPDEKFGTTAPDFDISIVEPNLESIRYTIDGGITNYTINQLSGTINQTAWDADPYGNITIRFYAEDIVGNSDYSQVVVEKVKGEKKILGYPILLFISMIGLITAISLKKKFN